MPQLFLGNFDFEQELAGKSSQMASQVVRRINAELAAVWVSVASTDDIIYMPESPDATFQTRLLSAGIPRSAFTSNLNDIKCLHNSQDVELIPWGATLSTKEQGMQSGTQYHQPATQIVRQANSRLISTQLEHELQIDLPGNATLYTFEDFQAAVAQLPEGISSWVIKHEFSNSARERILGTGNSLSPQQQNWMTKRWNQRFPLFFEPWVRKIDEAGIHFSCSQTSSPHFEGFTPLLTDQSGRYQGSRINQSHSVPLQWSEAVDIGYQVASKLQQMGYFGPLSIDAIRYRNQSGEISLRPVQDINARYSMGRLALGFRKLLTANEQASWLHAPSTTPQWEQSIKRLLQQYPAELRIIPTSPASWNNRPAEYRTWLCISSNEQLLRNVENILLGSSAEIFSD